MWSVITGAKLGLSISPTKDHLLFLSVRLLYFDDVHVSTASGALEVRRAPRVRVRHVALERDVLPRSTDRRVRLRVEIFIAPRIRPRQPVDETRAVVGVDPHHHDLILIQLPSARRRRRVIPRVVKPLRTGCASRIEKRQPHPRLLRTSTVTHMPTRLMVQQTD